MANESVALLLRAAVLDAFERGGRPCSAAAALRRCPRLAASAHAMARLARSCAALGPDERGRRLVPLPRRDEGEPQLWTVLPPPELAPLPPSLRLSIADRAAALALPGEGLADVLDRALASLEAERT